MLIAFNRNKFPRRPVPAPEVLSPRWLEVPVPEVLPEVRVPAEMPRCRVPEVSPRCRGAVSPRCPPEVLPEVRVAAEMPRCRVPEVSPPEVALEVPVPEVLPEVRVAAEMPRCRVPEVSPEVSPEMPRCRVPEVSRFWTLEDRTSAHRYFANWHWWASGSGLKPIAKVAGMLQRHLDGLLNYFEHRVTNATSEGFNSRIQSIKSAARGFRNFANYRIRILFYCGKLNLQPDITH